MVTPALNPTLCALGTVHSRLTVVAEPRWYQAKAGVRPGWYVTCRCSCGSVDTYSGSRVVHGKSRSCGNCKQRRQEAMAHETEQRPRYVPPPKTTRERLARRVSLDRLAAFVASGSANDCERAALRALSA